jgi:Na+/proline symporter
MLGKSGAVALLITLFMAVASCDSAELIAVSSILKFNIYKIYTKPPASPESLVKVAHINVGFFGLTMAIFHHLCKINAPATAYSCCSEHAYQTPRES